MKAEWQRLRFLVAGVAPAVESHAQGERPRHFERQIAVFRQGPEWHPRTPMPRLGGRAFVQMPLHAIEHFHRPALLARDEELEKLRMRPNERHRAPGRLARKQAEFP